MKSHGTSPEQTCDLDLNAAPIFDNWKKVRHVPASANTWHPASDRLAGTEVYGTESPLNSAAAWSIKFDDIEFDYFLFATGDQSLWMIMTKDELLGQGDFGAAGPELKSIVSAS